MSPGSSPFSSEPAAVFMVSGEDALQESAPPSPPPPEEQDSGDTTNNINITISS
jgi:hypothetical protein